MNSERIRDFLRQVTAWANDHSDILAVALVGSYARGKPHPDSDVDLVIIVTNPAPYLSDVTWISQFGRPTRYQSEDYGLVTSLRVWYRDGLEVEYGLTDLRWVAMPLDEGTRQVIADGMIVLFEQGNVLSRLQHAKRSGPAK